MAEKLYRDQKYGMLAGVCEGFGDYFGYDPTWFRLFFVISSFFFPPMVIIYFLFALIIPNKKR